MTFTALGPFTAMLLAKQRAKSITAEPPQGRHHATLAAHRRGLRHARAAQPTRNVAAWTDALQPQLLDDPYLNAACSSA